MAGSLIRDYPWTDAGNSERLIKEHGENIRYIEAWESWIAWHGSRWEVDKGYLYRMAELVARKMHEEAESLKVREGDKQKADDSYRTAAKAFARKSESASSIRAMLELARWRAGVGLEHSKLDGSPMILPVRNGTIDLETGKLRNSQRSDFATLVVPIKYDPAAKCPKWEAYLTRAMAGDEEKVAFLQRAAGYSVTGNVGEHVLFFNHGSKGMNGKSTFLTALRAMVGGYGATAPRKLLFQSIGDRHPTELTTLFGKRLVTCAEIPEDQQFDEALLKDLTGGDRISARRQHENFWEFDPTHKLWLSGNHKPTVRGTDGGIWRRIILIPWEVTISEAERDLDFTKKLREEIPGILAWSVRGCLAWQKQRLNPPASIVKATLQYRRESDLLGEFFRQFCVFEPKARMSKRILRQAYEEWCKEVGTTPLGPIKFYRRLREKDCEDTSVREVSKEKPVAGPPVDGWRGVRLASEAERKAVRRWDPGEL